MSAKYLKLLKKFPVALDFGRIDIQTLILNPEDSPLAYASVVDENEESPTYNKVIVDSYISNDILVVITLPDAIIPPTTVIITNPI